MLKPDLQCVGDGAFGRQLGHKSIDSRALMNRISDLIKEPPQFPHSFCEDREKMTAYEEIGPQLDTDSASILILEFPAFRL